MYLRFDDQQFRIRISQDEASRLIQNKVIQELVCSIFGRLQIEVKVENRDVVECFLGDETTVNVRIPIFSSEVLGSGLEWASSMTNREGDTIQFCLEIDRFKTEKRSHYEANKRN